ncbi:SAM-dependent MidA family methyltransferase [Dongia mobilis]|uniref:SAM-dependent MidA family methyltransferase n=1 Tax=Dongia mobilis TaxID=578943 RepID=A0A4R6WS66_9PROT|nr:SAM-dependent methyltransferase [Dongia mobilis]TDQ82427.1 SAM-dependent MidA family methyltransferase [Dongia mobilis]
MSEVMQSLQRRLAAEGSMTIAAYMETLLAGSGGYYRARDPLGAEGDFITAPEVSQMFGELLGLWCVDTWQRLGTPAAFHLIEIGPGRGTLMQDALRAARVLPDFLKAKQLHLVEINQALRAAQAERLTAHDPRWHDSVATVPEGPALIIANELFDALPVHQFVMTEQGWRERVVTLHDGKLAFALSAPGPALALLRPAHDAAKAGEIAEVSPAGIALVDAIARRLGEQGGAALLIDYGPAQSGLGDTFQALRRHTYHDPLETPGEADLTAHVDFAALAEAARQAGAATRGPFTQGDFLRSLGIEMRCSMLAAKADAGTAAILERQCRRLIAPDEMGRLFKVLAVTQPDLQELAGL